MKLTRLAPAVLAAGLIAGIGVTPAVLSASGDTTPANAQTAASGASFARTATYPVYENRPEGVDIADETVAEISDISEDGKTMVYTDAAGKRIGFLDVSDPGSPKGLGTVSLATLGNADDEPTSVAVVGEYVLVVISETGKDYENPKGRVDVIKLSDRKKVGSYDLGGQPDSIAISPDGKRAAIAIENERDEDKGDGGLPQMPTGFVQTIKLEGDPASDWKPEPVRFHSEDGTPLPKVAEAGLDTPEDLEPEYVSINSRNQLAVTLQENNGVAIIDLNTNEITSVFSTGSVDLKNVDAKKDKLIKPTDSLGGVPREPDAIAWIDDEHLATANEGDWKGGSRGWSVFDSSGKVVWDAGSSIEDIANRYGLHNNKRAEKKGPEIEGIATATMNGTRYAFVGSERSNFVAVYNVDNPAKPEFVQLLFTTNGPEGILPVENRNMLLVSSEVDEAKNGVRSAVNVYQLSDKKDPQPSIVADKSELGFSALGALTAHPTDAKTLYAASDSALAEGRVYTVDVSDKNAPARITDARSVMQDGKPAEGLDIEGISAREDGGFWIASEGKTGDKNAIHRTDGELNIKETISLPDDVAKHIGKWGLEGVDAIDDGKGGEYVYAAIQRPLWKDPEAKPLEALEGDNTVRIGRYSTTDKTWEWFSYELDSTDKDGDWMGLSELTVVDKNTLAVIERDKQNGPNAAVKRIMKVTLPDGAEAGGAVEAGTADEAPIAGSGTAPGADGSGSGGAAGAAEDGAKPQKVKKAVAVDVLPKLQALNGWTQEKLEGFTIAADGEAYAVTDNDALDDATGETVFLRLGKVFGEDAPPAEEEPGDDNADGPSDNPTGGSEDGGQEGGTSGDSGDAGSDDGADEAGDEPTDKASDKATGNASDKAGPEAKAPSSKGGALPRTGVSIAAALAAAAAFIGGGFGLRALARRRG